MCPGRVGARVGEYLRLSETDLHPITKSVSILVNKTAGRRSAASGPRIVAWVVAAVPDAVAYGWLRLH